MDSKHVDCDGRRHDGTPCGLAAEILSAKHIYHFEPGNKGFEYFLLRSYYEVDCPRCGRRSQAVANRETGQKPAEAPIAASGRQAAAVGV